MSFRGFAGLRSALTVGLALALGGGLSCSESPQALPAANNSASPSGTLAGSASVPELGSSAGQETLGRPQWSEIQGLRVLVQHFGTGGADAHLQRLPMVIAVHGLGSRPERFIGLFRQMASRGPRRLIVPSGFDPYGQGYSWFPRDGDEAVVDAAMGANADRFASLIKGLVDTFPTEGKPKITGFSQGGAMSFLVAIRHPELISGAYPVGGWVPPALWPAEAASSSPPVVAFHGSSDDRVPVERARETVAALSSVGFSAKLNEEANVGHTVSPSIQSALVELLSQDGR